jgi:hypothetical protein
MFRTTSTAPIASVNKSQRLNYEGDVKGTNGSLKLPPYTYGGLRGALPTVKAFCKVCHDAGKPESIYTSHFVRAAPSPDAPVVCPTLLAQPCRYCSVAGHTVKYCPALIKDQVLKPVPALPNQEEFQTSFVKQDKQVLRNTAKQDYIKSVNAFAALALSDDDDDESDTQSVTATVDTEAQKEDQVELSTSMFDELNNLSKDALFSLLDAVLQLNPTSDNKLIIAIEKAITKKEQQHATIVRPPFCSPRPTPIKPIVIPTTQQSKDWADYEDDEEMDFNVELNFPPLPPPANKRTYADMLLKN